MKLKAFTPATNWFQYGWNMVLVRGTHDLNGLTIWDLYDFTAGIGSAMYKQTLPDHWLQ